MAVSASRITNGLKRLRMIIVSAGVLIAGHSQSYAQDSAALDSTVVYTADYFAEFNPVNVNDMIDRVPGISVALNAGTPSGGGATNNNNANNRGLGAGAQILIDGKRLAGKDNEARTQLSRIAASQVRHIEIIRGTSGDLDVRSAGQIVNIVLLETLATSTVSLEAGAIAYHDNHVEPQGSAVYSGQRGGLNYLFSAERRSAYEALESWETSFNGNFSPNDFILVDQVRDQRNLSFNTNLTYDLTLNDRFAFNALYSETDPPTMLDRQIINLNLRPAVTRWERETLPSARDNWEVGGDYEHVFANGSRYRVLVIANEETQTTVRERFAGTTLDTATRKNLFLSIRHAQHRAHSPHVLQLPAQRGPGRRTGRGARADATGLGAAHGHACGMAASPRPRTADLVPVAVPNANSTVQEIRYEVFGVHNWQINPQHVAGKHLADGGLRDRAVGRCAVNKRDFTLPAAQAGLPLRHECLHAVASVGRALRLPAQPLPISQPPRPTTAMISRRLSPAIPRSSRKRPGAIPPTWSFDCRRTAAY
jgi:outer membrane receptor for ferrienterochelin and colicins